MICQPDRDDIEAYRAEHGGSLPEAQRKLMFKTLHERLWEIESIDEDLRDILDVLIRRLFN